MLLPANPLLQLVPARTPQAIKRVRDLVWSHVADLTEITASAATPDYTRWPEAKRLPLKPLGAFPHHYGKLWDQRWFRLSLPARRPDAAPLYLHWRDQAEATLYVDSMPHYGFDVAHRHAPLPSGVREVWVESVVGQTAIWHPAATGLDPEGSRLEAPQLFTRNEEAWQVLHDFLVLDDLMRAELRAAFPGREAEFGPIGTKPAIDLVPPLLRRLLRFLDDAVNALDRDGLSGARRVLARAYRELKNESAHPAAVLTGHAHIDLVWMWPERIGEIKAVHTFATANRLFEAYPEFRFAYSQPASYEAVARLSPKLHAAARRRMSEGRWEAQGATYVESDTLLACGEALARSFLLGQDGFATLTGKPSPILWLPDVFGYSGCLPQLMRESGVEYFFTTKLTWNAITPFPHSSFRWVGADGSEVVAHLCQNNGYNQTVSADELRRGAAAHRQCDVHPEFLAPSGYGDGGGGVTEEMCERARRSAKLAGLPAPRWGRLDGFFERLGRVREQLPAYRGELYFEYHRGTYTTHGDIKAGMRRAERALQAAEAVRCATGGTPLDNAAWKRVVFAQFHDYIPGSSVHEVYDEARVELAAIAAHALAAAGAELAGKARAAAPEALFNPLPLARVWRHEGRSYRLPALGGGPLAELATVADDVATKCSPRGLANARVAARFDATGALTALRVDGRDMPLTAPANQFVLCPEHPHFFEAWDIDRQALSLGRIDRRTAKVTIDAVAGEVAFSRPLGKQSRVTIRYRLDAGSPVLRIAYELDWQESHMLLKVVFPTGFLGHDARYGAPFGSVRRPQLAGSMTDEARWEVPASRWAMVTDDAESAGLMVMTEAKYGFSCRDGLLGLSLVRSADITSESRGAARGSHPEPLRRTLAPHVCSDIGAHRIDIAVGSFDPQAPREEQPAALAELLFTPPVPYRGAAVESGYLGLEGGASLQPVWARPLAPGRWVLRLHETLGRAGEATLHLAAGWTARRVDLSGRPIEAKGDGRRVRFKAYQVVGIEIMSARHS